MKVAPPVISTTKEMAVITEFPSLPPVKTPRLSQPSLKKVLQSNPDFKKKLLYDVNAHPCCAFCRQKGHSYYFCAGRESEPTVEQKCSWTEELINSQSLAPMLPAFADLDDALRWFEVEGTKLNNDNPFKDSRDPVFKLRSRLGFWKLLGANN